MALRTITESSINQALRTYAKKTMIYRAVNAPMGRREMYSHGAGGETLDRGEVKVRER